MGKKHAANPKTKECRARSYAGMAARKLNRVQIQATRASANRAALDELGDRRTPWQIALDRRRTRRLNDPQVQKRARKHDAKSSETAEVSESTIKEPARRKGSSNRLPRQIRGRK